VVLSVLHSVHGQCFYSRVGELQNANSSHNTSKTREVRNTSSNDERNRPVNRDQSSPEDLSRLRGQRWSVEHLDENVVVQDLDTDVAVQTSSDECRHHGEYVTSGLDIVG